MRPNSRMEPTLTGARAAHSQGRRAAFWRLRAQHSKCQADSSKSWQPDRLRCTRPGGFCCRHKGEIDKDNSLSDSIQCSHEAAADEELSPEGLHHPNGRLVKLNRLTVTP
jgi:hypothetical protein